MLSSKTATARALHLKTAGGSAAAPGSGRRGAESGLGPDTAGERLQTWPAEGEGWSVCCRAEGPPGRGAPPPRTLLSTTRLSLPSALPALQRRALTRRLLPAPQPKFKRSKISRPQLLVLTQHFGPRRPRPPRDNARRPPPFSMEANQHNGPTNSDAAPSSSTRPSPSPLTPLPLPAELGPLPSFVKREALAQQLDMTPRSVKIWFQNRRQRLLKPPLKPQRQAEGAETSGAEASQRFEPASGDEVVSEVSEAGSSSSSSAELLPSCPSVPSRPSRPSSPSSQSLAVGSWRLAACRLEEVADVLTVVGGFPEARSRCAPLVWGAGDDDSGRFEALAVESQVEQHTAQVRHEVLGIIQPAPTPTSVDSVTYEGLLARRLDAREAASSPLSTAQDWHVRRRRSTRSTRTTAPTQDCCLAARPT